MKRLVAACLVLGVLAGLCAAVTCPECGHKMPPGAKFCPECGHKIEFGRRPGSRPAAKPSPATKPKPKREPANAFDPRNVPAHRVSLTFGPFTGSQVDKAIARCAEDVLSKQLPDGSWEWVKLYRSSRSGIGSAAATDQFELGHKIGATAIAVYALLESGMSHQDERISRALTWLTKQEARKTYDLAFRANAYLAAVTQGAAKYRDFLKRDAIVLATKSNAGGYTYDIQDGYKAGDYDNSNSQYGLLGVWAAAQADIEIPRKYWQLAWDHWRRCQNRDGGWGYGKTDRAASAEGTASMATAGLASMLVCYDQLYSRHYVRCGYANPGRKHIEQGLKWLDDHFAASFKPSAVQDLFYHLYGVERVALASGHKYFGDIDWYRHGTAWLLDVVGKCKWRTVWRPAYAILIMVRGRHPVLFNKLKRAGDWNNRSRDLANLTRWMSNTFERRVNWQIIDIGKPVRQWHDAPILYIAGAKSPQLAEAEIAKLRRYVLQGGTVFSVAECGDAGFRTGIRKVYRKMFPQHELNQAARAHEIFSKAVGFNIPASQRMFIMSNGVRPIVIHTDTDLAVDWQMRRKAAGADSFRIAANVVRYVVENTSLLRHRAQSHWPAGRQLTAAKTTLGPIRLARLKFAGNCDPERMAFERFRQVMAVREGIEVEIVGPVVVGNLPATGARFATLGGTGKLVLTPAEQTALKAFVDGGGTLLVEAVGGSSVFAESAKDLLAEMFPENPLQRLAPTAKVFNLPGFEISSVTYRRRSQRRLNGRSNTPRVRAVVLAGRPGVFFSREDLTCGLLGCPFYTLDGYRCRSARVLMRNMLLLAYLKRK